MSKPPLSWHTEKRRVDQLVPYSKNPRVISEKKLDDLRRSLKKFNLAELPCINTDNMVVAGHQRLLALKLLGRGGEEIEVRVPNRKLSEEEFDRYLLTSNAVTGDWDLEKLRAFDIDTLLNIGFDDAQLATIWDGNLSAEDDLFQVEKELERNKKPKSKVGELYSLGMHRLAVGDATDPEVFKRLFGKERASLIYVDPIYNIGLDYDKGIGGKGHYGGTVNDKQTDDAYRDLLRKSMENSLAFAQDDVHCMYWCDEAYIWMIQSLYKELGITNRRVCAWIKGAHNPTPNVAFNKVFEPCVYGTRGKPPLTPGIDNLNEIFNKDLSSGNRLIDDILDLLNIWLVKRLAGNEYEHPTSKPPSLHEKAIRRCTKPGDIILDCFAGSSSTMVASEQLKRRAFLVELEPRFADLSLLRYEKLTGNKAKKLN
jgi:DNA modification methylase